MSSLKKRSAHTRILNVCFRNRVVFSIRIYVVQMHFEYLSESLLSKQKPNYYKYLLPFVFPRRSRTLFRLAIAKHIVIDNETIRIYN